MKHYQTSILALTLIFYQNSILPLLAKDDKYIQLHCCRELEIFHPNEATCWPWMATCNASVTEQSVTQQPKCICDLQHFIFALTGIDKHLERFNLINWVVMSSPKTYMIVLIIFFKLHL